MVVVTPLDVVADAEVDVDFDVDGWLLVDIMLLEEATLEVDVEPLLTEAEDE